MSNAQAIARSSVTAIVGQRPSTYRGKYPARIKTTSFSKSHGLYLESNDGTTVRLSAAAAWAYAQTTGQTKDLPRLGDDITPFLARVENEQAYPGFLARTIVAVATSAASLAGALFTRYDAQRAADPDTFAAY